MPLEPNAADIAIAEIREHDPELNVRPGGALSELLINTFQIIMQPLVREFNGLREQQSLANAAALTEESLDDLAANIFAFRRTGLAAAGVVRLYFREAENVSVDTGVIFRSKDGVGFVPISAVTYTVSEMRLNADGDRFYVDVVCKAQEPGRNGNVEANDIIRVENGPSGVTEVANPASFVGGEDRETNARFAARLPDAISLRALVNGPGISQVILDAFPQVSRITSIGFGDEEMERDFLSGTNLSLGGESFADVGGAHIGGHADIYVRTLSNVERSVSLIQANGDVRPEVVFGRTAESDEETAPDFEAPVLAVVSVELADAATGVCSGEFLVEGTDYVVEPQLPAFAFSTKAVTVLRFLESSVRYAEIFEGEGRSLIVAYLTNPDIASVQAFVEDPANRPVCANLLVRSFAPVFVDVDVTYFAIPAEELTDGQEEATVDVVESAIREFLSESDNSNGFNVDDLMRVLYGLAIRRVNKPVTVRTERLEADGSKVLEPFVGGTDDTEFQILDRGTLLSVLDSIDVPLPTKNLGHIGVGIGDLMTFRWGGNEVALEVQNALRAAPGDTKLTVARLEAQAPLVNESVEYEIRRDTVVNIASLPRTSAVIARNVRVLRLAI